MMLYACGKFDGEVLYQLDSKIYKKKGPALKRLNQLREEDSNVSDLQWKLMYQNRWLPYGI